MTDSLRAQSARQAYVENDLQHAPPQRLRLALIQGAIHYAAKAREAWQSRREEEGFETMLRCREILVELLAGIRPDGSELVAKVQALYDYLLHSASEAQRTGSAELAGEMIGVLEEERTTWQLVCEQHPETIAQPASHAPQEILAPKGEAILPTGYGRQAMPGVLTRGGHSFEA